MPAQPVQVGTPGWHGTPFLNTDREYAYLPNAWNGWISIHLVRRGHPGRFRTISRLFPPALTSTFVAPKPIVAMQAVNRSSVW